MQIFLDDTITIKTLRKKWSNRMNKVWSATATAYEACLQQSPPEIVQMYGGDLGKMYSIYIEATPNIKESDKVYVASDRIFGRERVYTVRGVKHVNPEFGCIDYTQLTVSEDSRPKR